MIRNLIFDFGKVLVDYDFTHLIHTFFTNQEDEQAYCDIVLTDEFTALCDLEEVPFAELIRQKQTLYPQYAQQLQWFHDRYDEFVTGEVEGMHDLLIRLKGEGFHLYGLTNWCHKVHDIIDSYPIFRQLEGWVISSEEKIIKPDPAIYLRLMDKFHLLPEECLFTDDKLPNVEGAIRTGMQAIHFQNATQYAKELQERIPTLHLSGGPHPSFS